MSVRTLIQTSLDDAVDAVRGQANIATTLSTAATLLGQINSTLANLTDVLAEANQTVPNEEYTSFYLRPETYLVPFFFAIIFVVGVGGNGILVAILTRHKEMRNIPNTYIFSLAIADLLVMIFSVPFVSIVYTFESWPWGWEICAMSEFVRDLSTGVSVFTLTALSSDRYFAIVHPMRKFNAHGGGKRATYATYTVAALIWMLAALFSIPALYGSNIQRLDINKDVSFAFCYPFPMDWPAYGRTVVMGRFLIYYTIPLMIVAVFYVLIAYHLLNASVPGETQGTMRQIKARKKVAVTVVTFVFIFAACFLPYHIFMLWFYFHPDSLENYNAGWHVLRIIGFCLSFANSCANPVALYCVSGSFRKYFIKYMRCQKFSPHHRKHDTMRETTMTSTMSRRSKRHTCNMGPRQSCGIQETSMVTLIAATPPPILVINGHQHHVDKDPDRI